MDAQYIKYRWWDLSAAILLTVAIGTAASRLAATPWTSSLTIIPTLAIIGVIAGIALGQSRFSSEWVFLIAFLYGLYLIPWQIGTTFQGQADWPMRMQMLLDRVSRVILQFVDRQRVSDPIFFVTLMAIVFFIISITAGYALTRHGGAWLAILPAGISIFIIQSYDPIPRRSLYLVVFLFLALFLIARLVYLHQQRKWKQSRTALPPHLGLDFIRFTFAAVTIIVLLAWTAPALAQAIPAFVKASEPLREAWYDLRDDWRNAFGSLRSSVGYFTNYYSNSAALGRGNTLSDSVVFYAKVPEFTPIGVRYYWRGAVYDTYSNGQWYNTIFENVPFDPNDESLPVALGAARYEDIFDFYLTTYAQTLFAPSQPIWNSQPGQSKYASNSDGTLDLAGFETNSPLGPQTAYRAQSSISNATISQLRQAGTEYPEWVTERYLELPDTITPRTRQLAQDITKGIDNPYDKVIAITNYLRNNMEYQETIDEIPEGEEPIDWFLFESRTGFCNYYSTSEVILLRSVGIPARWAVGYAQGEALEESQFAVRQRDAHSWPEVYFPGFGWVEFEPTVSQPEIVRLEGTTDLDQADNDSEELSDLEALRRQNLEDLRNAGGDSSAAEPAGSSNSWLNYALVGILILFIAGMGYLAWRFRSRFNFQLFPVAVETAIFRLGFQPPKAIRNWAHRAALPPLSKAYLEINAALRRLGLRPPAHLTPAERVDLLSNMLPPTSPPANTLLREYQISTFGQFEGDLAAAQQAGANIRWLSIRAAVRNIFYNVTRPKKRSLPPLKPLRQKPD
jgi:transglutaminase-like putative cysteine protease